jgi:hypothetical protein
MKISQLLPFAVSVIAAVVLSGCFVVSTNIPAGAGPEGDERLIGAWQGLDSDDKQPADAFLHFQQQSPDGPLRLVWVEDKQYQIYEVTTRKIGTKNVFAVMLTGPDEAMKDEGPKGYFLGFYTFKTPDEVMFQLLDAEKVGDLIARGKLKGTRKPGKYEMATLTGSPDELARFLASPEADAARVSDPATIRRLTRRKGQ